MKPTHVQGTQYGDMTASPTETVAQVKRRWLAERTLDSDPELVNLHLVPCTGEEEPAPEQEAEATVLPPRKTLAQAGVVDGSWLVAVTLSTGESGQPTCCPPRAAPDSAATQLTSTSRAPCATQSGAWQRRKTS